MEESFGKFQKHFEGIPGKFSVAIHAEFLETAGEIIEKNLGGIFEIIQDKLLNGSREISEGNTKKTPRTKY